EHLDPLDAGGVPVGVVLDVGDERKAPLDRSRRAVSGFGGQLLHRRPTYPARKASRGGWGVGTIDGQSTAGVNAPVGRRWGPVQDVERAPAWQGGMKKLTGLERDGEQRVLLAEVEVDAKVRTLSSQVRFTYDSPTRLTWVQERGQPRSVVGSWELV